MTIRKLTLVLLAALALAPAAAATRATSAPDFAGQFFRWVSNGQWDRTYNSMHPAQQRFVNRDRYIDCMENAPIPAFDVLSWKTVDTLHARSLVPGTKLRPWSTVVTLRLKLRDPDTGHTESLGQTFHLYLVNGHWHWVLDAASTRAFKAGRCPK